MRQPETDLAWHYVKKITANDTRVVFVRTQIIYGEIYCGKMRRESRNIDAPNIFEEFFMSKPLVHQFLLLISPNQKSSRSTTRIQNGIAFMLEREAQNQVDHIGISEILAQELAFIIRD